MLHGDKSWSSLIRLAKWNILSRFTTKVKGRDPELLPLLPNIVLKSLRLFTPAGRHSKYATIASIRTINCAFSDKSLDFYSRDGVLSCFRRSTPEATARSDFMQQHRTQTQWTREASVRPCTGRRLLPMGEAAAIFRHSAVLNVRLSATRGGRAPARVWRRVLRCWSWVCNGHGCCLSCFLWQIIHGTIREWHLNGSKLFVFVSLWLSFSTLKIIW